MLLEFSCSNHKSIREKVLFSTLASKDNTNIDKTFKYGDEKVLKAAVIYGANGSGKSNFIDAISFMKYTVINSVNNLLGQGVGQSKHKLENENSTSEYKIQYLNNGTRYAYGFTLKNSLISEEYLYYFPNGRKAKIFERSGDDFNTGTKFNGKLASCKDILKPNKLLLSCAANYSKVEEIIKAHDFFLNELVIYDMRSQENWLNYSLHQIHSDLNMKKAVLSIFQGLGIDIKDIVVKIDKKELEASQLPPFLSDELKKQLVKKQFDAITTKIIYEKFSTDLLEEESVGIKKLFALLCPIIDIMLNGKVLVCDELESSFHEALLFGLIKSFIDFPSALFPQLIFTTHETGVLDLDLFRRDQIWFTELKNDDRSTDLYSMAELKNIRKDEKYGKGYISGRYGAIPMLNLDLAKIMSQF